jgi:hypothetical protein
VAFGIAGFLGCLAALVILILMIWKPQPAAVFLIGANYATNLAVPHNVPGWEGLDGIRQVSQKPPRWSLFYPPALQLVLGDRDNALNALSHKGEWDVLIANLKKKGVTAPTLLMVVALHGGSRADGAYLMPDAIAKPEDGLDLKDVIASMGKLRPEQNKILVLEGAEVPAAWRLGMVHNDFARKLKELEPEIEKVPNLWVLSGCNENQRCWASEALGRTIFTHYIIEALRGAATGPDGRLSLAELHEYVKKNVRDWAWNARGALQEPQLLPASRGGKGAATGRTDPKDVYLAASTTATAPQSVLALDPKSRSEIQEAWRTFHSLESKVPHPAVYSPRRWREYRAAVVRYEELLRAGAVGLAQEFRNNRLALLDGNLNEYRFLKKALVSADVNLDMNALQGGAIEPTTQSADFERLIKASSPATASAEWKTLSSSLASTAGVDRPRSPRTRVEEMLVQYAAGELQSFITGDVSGTLKNAADRLTAIKGGQPFSAEAHFLRMLDKYLNGPALKQKPQRWDVVKSALLVRRQAERAALAVAPVASGAYHYSEQIQPWIKSSITAADEKRRLGEDLLFSSVDSDWQSARTALREAKRLYDQAILDAGKIRAALEIRDRVLAGLPDYSRWLPLSEHPTKPRPAGEPQSTADLTGPVEDLWEKTHKLSDLLEANRGGDAARLSDIQKRAVDLKKNFEALEKQFQTHVATLDNTRREEDWEAAVAAAAVAFPENDSLKLRNDILVRLDNIRQKDDAVAKNIAARKSEIEMPDKEQPALAQRISQRRASLQARMALAVLGESWFKEAKKGSEAEFKDASDLIRKLMSESSSETWSQDAGVVGDLIGQRWQRMSEELKKNLSRITDYAALQSALVQHDRLGRRIDAAAEPPSEGPEASTLLRVTRVRDVLLWLADRTWEDHWFGEDPNARTPYYQSAVSDLVTDSAAQLREVFPEILESKSAFDFSGHLELELQDVESVVLTSEKNASAAYKVLDKGRVPKQGIPVVKPIAGPGLELVVPGGVADYGKAPRQSEGSSVKFKFFSRIIEDAESKQGKADSLYTTPEVKQSNLTIKGFFRGQVFSVDTPVDLYPVADVVAIGPPPADPPDVGVAVKANADIIKHFGQGTGSITILLDCSGSMKFTDTTTNAKGWVLNDKLTNAKSAISSVLKEIPKGTTVRVWTFSQLPEDIKTDADGVPVDGNNAHFLQVKAEPESTIQCLREPSRWDPNQVDNLRARLDGLRPFLATPLVEAMVKAAQTDLVNAKGMKTLLVLTDGNDTRFKESKALAPFRQAWPDIPSFISSYFKTLGITINMVFLCINDKDPELEEARKNFAASLENLTPPGRFVPATGNQLTQSLRRALRQQLTYDIVKPDGTVVQQSRVVSGERDDDPLDWSAGLNVGTYLVRVHADRPYDQRVELERGDRLIVQLVDDEKGGIGFERGIYGDENEVRSRPYWQRTQNDWRLTAISPQTVGDPPKVGLRLLTTLEPNPSKKAGSKGVPLRQMKPTLTWFELNNDGNQPAGSYSLRWHERIKYPAPAWLLEVPLWVIDRKAGEPAKPILGTWWSEPTGALSFVPVAIGNAVEFQSNLPRKIKDEGDTLTLESLDIEDHVVEVQPGAPVEQQSCLVIRLRFSKDSPYIVDPDGLTGLDIAGHEHRLYTKASKYTGLFWPVSRGQLRQLESLNLISVARFKKQAKDLGNSVADMKLKADKPDIGAKMPDPVRPLQP